MMVRWLSHEKDILSNWSDTGQMIFQCKGLIQSNGHRMVRWFSKEGDELH